MRIQTPLLANIIVWCLLWQYAPGQQTNGAGATGLPSSAGATSGCESPTIPPTNGTMGITTAPNSSPTDAGTQPMSGVQPGQTGSMESQRLNALNQEYQNEQQRKLARDRQQTEQQAPRNDSNHFAPSQAGGTGRTTYDVSAKGPHDDLHRAWPHVQIRTL